MAKVRKLVAAHEGGAFKCGYEYDTETLLLEKFGGRNIGSKTGVVTATHIASGQQREVTFAADSGVKVLDVASMGITLTEPGPGDWEEPYLEGINFTTSYQ